MKINVKAKENRWEISPNNLLFTFVIITFHCNNNFTNVHFVKIP